MKGGAFSVSLPKTRKGGCEDTEKARYVTSPAEVLIICREARAAESNAISDKGVFMNPADASANLAKPIRGHATI